MTVIDLLPVLILLAVVIVLTFAIGWYTFRAGPTGMTAQKRGQALLTVIASTVVILIVLTVVLLMLARNPGRP
jgi:magnesium-transporting ATPase (P-type)